MDGDVDLVVGDFNGGAFVGDPQNKIRVLTNDGAGSMTQSVIVDSVFPSTWLTWANVDNTAGVDIVAIGVVHSNSPPPTPSPLRRMKIYLESSGFASSIIPIVTSATANSASNVATGIQAADGLSWSVCSPPCCAAYNELARVQSTMITMTISWLLQPMARVRATTLF